MALLLIDMDGVCCDLMGPWLALYNDKYNDNLVPDDIKNWDTHKFVKPECGTKMYDLLNGPGFFAELPPVPDVSEVLGRLHAKGHDIVLATVVPRFSPTGAQDKRTWMRKHLPFLPDDNIIAAYRKELIRGDLLLDDGPHNLIDFPGLTCAFEHHYNKGAPSDYRVTTWLEFEELINNLEF